MNFRKTISAVGIFLLSTVVIVSCVKDTDYQLPDIKIEIPPFDGSIVTFTQALTNSNTDLKDYSQNHAIEGYVVSSDENGNFYKKIYVQNEEKTEGITVAIDKTGLYADYPVGSKIQIRLKGLSTQIVNGKLEIGYGIYTSRSGKQSVGSISTAIQKTSIYNLGQSLKTNQELTTASSEIAELKVNTNVNKMVTFQNVSFEPSAIGNDFHLSANDNYYGTDYNLVDDKGEKVVFRTSRYAKFAKEKVPAGKLEVTGVLTMYNNAYQFMINSTDDIKIIGTNGNINTQTTTSTLKTVKEIRDLFSSQEITISEDISIKVVITSDKDANNLHNRSAFAQDDTAGITLYFSQAHNYAIGQELTLSIKGATISSFNGLLQLGNITANMVTQQATATVPAPRLITIEQALSGDYQSQLVSISNVQFKNTGSTYKGTSVYITDCTNDLLVYTRNQAIFASETVSDKNGTITGNLSVHTSGIQLILRTKNDVDFNQSYNNCSSNNTGTTTGTTTNQATKKFDFENLTSNSTSYNTEDSLTASDGTKLSFKARTDVQGYEIENKGLMFRRGNDNGYIKLEFPDDNVTELTFQVRGAFNSKTERIILVLNGDENSTTEIDRKTFPYDGSTDTTIHTMTLSLNKVQTVTLKLGTEAQKNAQVVIDNISWK